MEGKVMKKFDKALKEIAAGVKSEVYDCIASGMDRANYEYDFGNTTIMVEIELVGTMVQVAVPDVWIDRDDSTHISPMVVAAVRNVLPDWWQVRQEVEDARFIEQQNERYLMAQRY